MTSDSTVGGPRYGSVYQPITYGSKGGGAYGGLGGGTVKFVVPSVIYLDGFIIADGADGSGTDSGGGSGGSVYLVAGMKYPITRRQNFGPVQIKTNCKRHFKVDLKCKISII